MYTVHANAEIKSPIAGLRQKIKSYLINEKLLKSEYDQILFSTIQRYDYKLQVTGSVIWKTGYGKPKMSR